MQPTDGMTRFRDDLPAAGVDLMGWVLLIGVGLGMLLQSVLMIGWMWYMDRHSFGEYQT